MIMQAFQKLNLLAGLMKIFYWFTSLLFLSNLQLYLFNFIPFLVVGNFFPFLFKLHKCSNIETINNYFICSMSRFYFLKINLDFHFVFISYLMRLPKDQLLSFSLQNIHHFIFQIVYAQELLMIYFLFSILEYFQINFLVLKSKCLVNYQIFQKFRIFRKYH